MMRSRMQVVFIGMLVQWSASVVWAAPPATECDTGKSAFSASLYRLQLARCTQCHGDQGNETPHSVSDVDAAYRTSLKLVDFMSIEDSRFMRKVKSRHWLDDEPNAVGASADEMRTALREWWEGGQKYCPSPFQFTLAPQAIPQKLPNAGDGKFIEMTWDLGAFGPRFGGCQLRVDLQRYSDSGPGVPGSYRLAKPRISCPTSDLTIQRLRFLLNGSTLASENAFEAVDLKIPASTEFTVVSSSYLFLIERPETPHLIAPAFGKAQ